MGVPVNRRHAVLICALIAGLTAASVGPAYADWYGSWGETGRALEDSTVLTYPVVAGVAAWFASEPKRRRYRWMHESASRPLYSVYLRSALVQVAMASMSFVGIALVACFATALGANFGQPPIIGLFTIVAGFAAMVGLGILIATAVPSLVSPIAALVSVYVVLVLADTGKPSLAPLAGLTVSDPRERTYRSTAAWMLELRGLWLVALALLSVAIAARAGSKWLVPFAVACLTAVPLLLAGDTGMKVDESATRPVCHQPDPQVTVCLTAARDHAYPEVWSALRPELAPLRGLAYRRWHLVEEGMDDQVSAAYVDGLVTVPFGIANGVNGNAHVVNRTQIQADFSTRLLQANCRSAVNGSDGSKPVASTQDVIQARLLAAIDVPIDGSDGLQSPQLSSGALDYGPVAAFRDRWATMTSDQRQAWLLAHGGGLVDCRLQTADLVMP